jgi:hypothetical protein
MRIVSFERQFCECFKFDFAALVNYSNKTKRSLFDEILLEGAQEARLFSMRLEPTMTKLASSINPLKTNLLGSPSTRLLEQRLSQSHDPFLDSRTTTLDHDEIIIDGTVSDKATEGGDSFFGGIEFGGAVRVLFCAKADAVDFMVDGGSVHVAIVTGTGDSPHDVGGMPGSDTGDLAKSLVCLAG